MIRIQNYLDDGANWQTQCVLAYLRAHAEFALEPTYDSEAYDDRNWSTLRVGRFENCREQGYVFSVIYKYSKQKNFCVYEHRNSDNICVLVNELPTINTPTLDEMWEGKKDKWDYDKSFKYGDIIGCGEWLVDSIKNFLNECKESEKIEVKEV